MNLITPTTIIFLKVASAVYQRENAEASGNPWLKQDRSLYPVHSGNRSGSNGMKRFPLLVCLAFVLLLVMGGLASADMTISTNTTTTAATTSPDRTGGSIFFETDPAGATVWVDSNQIGTSDLTYYSEKTGMLNVLIRRKGYEDFTASVTVEEGGRIEFFASSHRSRGA